MSDQVLSLKWNNHQLSFISKISNLYNKDRFTDVTIACDEKFYPAHKIILSTCSEYFDKMFMQIDCKNPVIVLKDISQKNIEMLLNYMYLGEVNVDQSELPSLMKAAECLRIKGLAVSDVEEKPKKRKQAFDQSIPKRRNVENSIENDRKISNSSEKDKHSTHPLAISGGSKNISKSQSTPPVDIKDIQEVIYSTVKTEKVDIDEEYFEDSSNMVESSNPENYSDMDPMKNELPLEEDYTDFQDQPFESVPPDEGDRDPNVSQQAHSFTNRRIYYCSLCSYRTTVKCNLEAHIRVHTGERPFSCTYCSFKTKQGSCLKRHIMLKHLSMFCNLPSS